MEIKKTQDKPTIVQTFQVLLTDKVDKLPPSKNEKVSGEREALKEKVETEEFGKLLARYSISSIDRDFQEGAVWMPGNIHRGPKGSLRLDNKNKNKKLFDQWLDDGGDKFEKASTNLLSFDHFKKLWTLN